MKKLICVFAFFSIGCANAQTNYSVVYEQDRNFESTPLKYEGNLPQFIFRLVFNDTLAYSYVLRKYEIDPFRKSSTFGKKIINHCSYYNSNSKIFYGGATADIGRKKYLYIDSAKHKDWVFINEEKNILGYNCKAAINISSQNDSLLVWYTPEIPFPFGPANYYGLPGLMLEVFDQASDRHYKAIKIEKGDYNVVMPTGANIILKGGNVFRKPHQ